MTVFEPYHKLRTDLDQHCQQLTQRWQSHLNCQRGCSGCCQQHLGLFPVEAAMVQAAIRQLSPMIQTQVKTAAQQLHQSQAPGPCPLLLPSEECAIYSERPVICRSHGLPISWPAEDEPETVDVDVCPLNLTAENAWDELDITQDTLAMDRLNLRLAATNMVYCRDILQDTSQAGDRILMADIVLRSAV